MTAVASVRRIRYAWKDMDKSAGDIQQDNAHGFVTQRDL